MVGFKLCNISALHWTAWGMIGILVCIITGYAASALIPWKRKKLTGLTVWDQVKENA